MMASHLFLSLCLSFYTMRRRRSLRRRADRARRSHLISLDIMDASVIHDVLCCHRSKAWIQFWRATGIMGSLPGIEPSHTRVLESQLLAKQSVLPSFAIKFASQPNSQDATVDGTTPGVGNRPMCQGNGLDHSQFDIVRPISRQGNALERARFVHGCPPKFS